jgi:hypothetical protein
MNPSANTLHGVGAGLRMSKMASELKAGWPSCLWRQATVYRGVARFVFLLGYIGPVWAVLES